MEGVGSEKRREGRRGALIWSLVSLWGVVSGLWHKTQLGVGSLEALEGGSWGAIEMANMLLSGWMSCWIVY